MSGVKYCMKQGGGGASFHQREKVADLVLLSAELPIGIPLLLQRYSALDPPSGTAGIIDYDSDVMSHSCAGALVSSPLFPNCFLL